MRHRKTEEVMNKATVISLMEGTKPPFPKYLLNIPSQKIAKLWFNNLKKELVDIPVPRDKDILIKTLAVAICATDISIIIDRRRLAGQISANKVERKRRYLGHEVVGKIINKGELVEGFEVGDRVVIGDFNSCLAFKLDPCIACRNGNGILCSQKILRKKQPPCYGGFSDYFIRSEYQCVKVPEDITDQDAALVEPAACAVQALRKSNLSKNSKVLIIGCGTIGVILVRLMRLSFGGSLLIHTLVTHEYQTELAQVSGSDLVSSNISDFYEAAKNLIDETKTLTGGYDAIFDFSVTEQSVKGSSELSKPGGKVLWLNFSEKKLSVSLSDFVFKGIEIIGSHGYGSDGAGIKDYLDIFKLLQSKKLFLGDIVSRVISLKNIYEHLIDSCTSLLRGKRVKEKDRVTHRMLAIQRVN